MKQLWTLEKQLSSASLYKRRDNSPKNSLSEMLSTPKQAKYFIWLLRHGSTQANMQDARAESNIPLLDFEFWSQSTIRVQARNLLKLWINVDDLCIHFDNKVVRDWQTAKVFCEELGLVFPTEDEMMDEKSMQKYPYLMVTWLIATRAKWDEKNMEITLMGDPNNIWAESTEDARRRITRYVQKLSSDIYSHKNNFSHHILIGHRTGTNWFIDAKFHRETIRLIQDIQESWISQLDYGLLNSSWEFINLADSWVQYGKAGWKIKHHNADVFEFSLQNYQQQVQDLKTDIPKLSILSWNDLINDTNIVNAYLASIKKDITEKDAPEQVAYYLKNKSEVVCDYVLTFAVAIIASQKYQQKELEWIVINHLKTHDISENKRCLLFEKLYHSKHEFWRCLFRLMYEKNKGIVGNSTMSKIIEEERIKIWLSSDGRLISKTNIEQEIEKIESIRKYEDIHIDTLLWNNIALKDFYVPQNLSVEEKNISADDLVNYILQSNKNIFAIQAAGGSGKTILSKYLLMNLSNSSVLQKNNAYSTRVKEIDLNKYTPDNIESILQWPESIFIIDALDEKKSDIVKKLTEISNSDTFKHSGKKLVILGRYIEDRFLYENESKKESIEAFQLQQEVTIVEYIQSFTKIIQPQHIQEKFEKELSDIVKILDKELHTPIIIEMLAKIVKKKLISWRNRKIFDDENNITRKVIYDKFFEYLHEREEQKSDSLWENSERLYINNPFMGEEYDQLRKDFLIFASSKIILSNQNALKNGIIVSKWDLRQEIISFLFADVFDGGIQKTDAYIKYKKYFDMSDMKSIEDFIAFMTTAHKELKVYQIIDKKIDMFLDTLFAYGFFKNEWDNKISFYHKSFLEYFNYLWYIDKFDDLEKYLDYIKLIHVFYSSDIEKETLLLAMPWFDNPDDAVRFLDVFKHRFKYEMEDDYLANLCNEALLNLFWNRKTSYEDIRKIWKIKKFVRSVLDGKEDFIRSGIEVVKEKLENNKFVNQLKENSKGLRESKSQLELWLKIIQNIKNAIENDLYERPLDEELNELWSICRNRKCCFTSTYEWALVNGLFEGLDKLHTYSLKDLILILNWDYLASIKYKQGHWYK